MLCDENMTTLLGFHDAIRMTFPTKEPVDKFFQQMIPDLPVPQPRPYWTNWKGDLLKKPKYKTYTSSSIGQWKAHFEMERQEHQALEVQGLQQQTLDQAAPIPLQQVIEEQRDINQQQAAEEYAVDAHYREYLDKGWASENALQFAAENNIDMTSLPGNPPYDLDFIHAAFNAGECEPLVPQSTTDPDFVL